MYAKLLLAVDGSSAGEAAVDAAIELARATGAKVLVLHVVEETGGPVDGTDRMGDAAKLVSELLARLAGLGFAASGDVLPAPAGQVGQVIADAAHDAQADTIVVGSRGRTEAKALLLGSVAYDVIQQFRGRVLVAR